MSALLGPILAQLITLGVSDRTEARYIVSDDKYAEAATYPRVGLNFGWKHAALTLGYGPSFTVTPLDSRDRDLVIFNSGAVSALYRWQRTTVTASEAVGYGEVSFRDQALGGAAAQPAAAGTPTNANGTNTGGMNPPQNGPPGNGGVTGTPPTPPPGTTLPLANQVRASAQIIHYVSSTTTIGIANAVSSILTVGGSLSYLVSGSVGNDAATNYPFVKGPLAEAHVAYRLSHFDDVTSSVTTQYALASNGNNAWFAVANEAWGHALDARTLTHLGAGLSLSRNSQPDGLVFWSIYPTFNASISHAAPAGRGAFTFGSSASAAPAIDPVRASVDPRISLSAFLGWGQDRFSTALTGGSALSLSQQNDQGAFNSIFASYGMSYRLATGVSVDTGVRGFWQSVGGQTTVPASFAGFLGLTLGALVPLNGGG